MTNADYAKKNRHFANCCLAADTLPTSRQASKFRRKHGLAWNARGLTVLLRNFNDVLRKKAD